MGTLPGPLLSGSDVFRRVARPSPMYLDRPASPRPLNILAGSILSLLVAQSAQAATYYWDADGSASLDVGSGSAAAGSDATSLT